MLATSPRLSGTIPQRRRCRRRRHPSPLRCSATPPFQPVPVRVLGGVQRIDSRYGKRASVVTFFSALAVVGGPVVAVAAPVLLSVTAVSGRGWSHHPTAKLGALLFSLTPALPPPHSFFSLLPLPSSRSMALANSTARSSAGRHCRRRSLPLSTTTTQVLDDDGDNGIDDATATSCPPWNAADGDRDAPPNDG